MNDKNIKVIAIVAVLVIGAVVGTIVINSGGSDEAENTNNGTSTEETTGNQDQDAVVTPGTRTMSMTDDGYSPVNVTIEQGTEVVFENNSDQARWPASNIHPTHEIYPEFDPKEEIPAGSSWSFTFDKIGEWGYHDHLRPSITGTIFVTEPSEQQPEPTQVPADSTGGKGGGIDF